MFEDSYDSVGRRPDGGYNFYVDSADKKWHSVEI